MIVGTAGHIDHGKTALVKALTGVDTDRLPEEKRRGITIDLGFAALQLEGVGTVGVIDVPGHEDFVRSMLVGASGIDLGLLVIAADEGVMPQTREHLMILSLLAIPRMVVALSKRDLVDEEWTTLVRADVSAMLEETAWPSAPIVECSARTGSGVGSLRQALATALSEARARATDDLFRLPVDRAFTVRGTGTVVTGTVWSGDVDRDATVRVIPVDREARVRRIEQHGSPVDTARAGARAAIALTGLEVTDVGRGSVLVTDDAWRPTSMFEAVVRLGPEASARIGSRTRVRLHAGASEAGARIVVTGAGLRPGERTLARVSTDAPIPLRGGDRFVLRLPAPLGTIGGGVVIDPYAKRRSLAVISASDLDALENHPAARVGYSLRSEGTAGVPLREVPVRTGCRPSDVPDLIAAAKAVAGPNNLFGIAAVESTMAHTRMIIAEYEISSPLNSGVPTQTLRGGLCANDELAAIAIGRLERSGELETDGPLVRRKGWGPSPSDQDEQASLHLAHDICAAEREPPSVRELVARYGSSVPALLRYLERQGRIVQVEADRYYDRSTVGEMVAKLREELVPGQVYVPAQLRDVLGFSRKYLIPFLEFCDRNGVTERRGEGRVLREPVGAVLDTPRPQV
ncbi:MAG: selenocysteine-specific translation elongation factor [Gemmatimonadaceae bacterium]